ncbi:hypothetical protein [Aquimarina litoralis]
MKTKLLLIFSTFYLVTYAQNYNFDNKILFISVDSEEDLLKYVPHPNGCLGTYIIKPISKENKYEHGFRVINYDKYSVESVNSMEIIPFSVFYKHFGALSEKTGRFLLKGRHDQELIFVKKEGDKFVFYPADSYFWTI